MTPFANGYTNWQQKMARSFEQMHVSDVLSHADSGDAKAIEELIRRQQQGQALRLYPRGRAGPMDQGVLPLLISRVQHNVVVTTGRKDYAFLLKSSEAAWIVNQVSKSMCGIIFSLRQQGSDKHQIADILEASADAQFGCNAQKSGDRIRCQLWPRSTNQWVLGATGVAILVRALTPLLSSVEPFAKPFQKQA